jgi:Protein of unknown function (DUF2934)
MTLSDIAAHITGAGSMSKYTGGRTSPTHDEIARLAYHFYETRGRWDGHDVDDWLSAERELTQEDEALARRFRCVQAEPTIEETRQILYQRRPRLEPHYSLALPDEALETALRLW